MDIQAIFYTLGSIYLIMGIGVMIGLGFLIWKAYQTLQKAQEEIASFKNTVGEKVSNFVTSRPAQVMSVVGAGLSSLIMSKAKDFIFRKKDKEKA